MCLQSVLRGGPLCGRREAGSASSDGTSIGGGIRKGTSEFPIGSILSREQKNEQADVEKEEREHRNGSQGSLSAWSRTHRLLEV